MRNGKRLNAAPIVVAFLLVAGLSGPTQAGASGVSFKDSALDRPASHGALRLALTLADPWTEPLVQQYLQTARKQISSVGPQKKSEFLASEMNDFLAPARQGASASTTRKPRVSKRLSCRVCASPARILKAPPLVCENVCWPEIAEGTGVLR